MDVERNRTGMPPQLGVDNVASADEQEPDLQVPGRDQRSVDDASGSMVTAHGVDGDAHQESFQLSASSFQLPGSRIQLAPQPLRERELLGSAAADCRNLLAGSRKQEAGN
jgi:hypothetical protein